MSTAETGRDVVLPEGAGHSLLVRDVVNETRDAKTVVFDVPDELAERFRYRPGQFLTLRMPGWQAAARCYSLSSAPDLDRHLAVTVKRVADGAVSNWMCDEVRAGDRILVLPPSGRFVPRSLEEDLLLVAGGSGITPMLSIIRSVLERGTGSVVLCYANRDEHSVIFAERLRELSERYPDRLSVSHLLESVEGLPTEARMRGLLGPFAGRDAAFLCGPEPFMDAAAAALRDLGVDRERIVVERFVSLTGDPFEGTRPRSAEDGGEQGARVTVDLDGQRHELDWPREAHLLDVLRSAGLDAPFSCREGACSACACRVTAGRVTMTRNEVLEEEDLAEGLVLGCQALPATDVVALTYDE
ncbi:2Fe-2S iron-sulfur cluster-binding protein [Saccharopolyspora flava]|uniref:2Fe-2S iron-sulfur cluster-binding protein n=1 Tax=Saccharopolyspora flava TaxID=95161 RepID=UPI001587A75E|nr:ferredoxin--NADP reductase [Saccharopolyspora flava]